MANAGWGYGRPADTDTGILQVLTGFITQGGQLYGARRWAENPLTLTHVRWQGPGGAAVEAFRRPDIDDNGFDSERQVWVQLALTVPTNYATSSGADAPWLPLDVGREKALEWGQALRQARISRQTPGHQSYSGGSLSMPRMPVMETRGQRQPGAPFSTPPYAGTRGQPSHPSYTAPRPSVPSTPVPVDMEPTMQYSTATNARFPANGEDRQFTNSWQRRQLDAPEVAVVPCVDVELPPAMPGVVATDYRRDFARDVAMHFTRAARAIPQVREVRGWMRGDHMVLAARFVVAAGNRPPTRAEMDGAAQILADSLAQRTLPYVRLGFADPGEWVQGAALPE